MQSLFQRKDVRWVIKHSAVIAVVLSLICQALPPQYRVLCDQILRVCSAPH